MSEQDPPEPRLADRDREQAVQRLGQALAEGRLTMDEYDERVAAVLQARTASELAPQLADLPGGAPATGTALEHGQLRTTMSTIKREGRWVVPRRLHVHSKAGTVKLDLTEAVITHPVIELEVELYAGSVTLLVPDGASVNVEPAEQGMVASTVKVRGVTRSTEPVGEPHVVISGKQWAGTVVVRRRRRFFRVFRR